MAASSTARREEIAAEVRRLIGEYFEIEPPVSDELACPLSVPLYGAEEVSEALDVLLSQNVTMGARVRAFEREFADFVGTRHAVMCNSGSSANLLGVSVLSARDMPRGLHPGDEIIVPAVTWPTTITPIIQNGFVPVFVDIDPLTLNLRPEELENAVTSRTRGIFVVHLLGNPVDMDPVMELARERGLWVLEDTCESLGSSIGGRMVGGIGDVGTFSFYFSHHITTIEGGMLVTDNDRISDLARQYAWASRHRS